MCCLEEAGNLGEGLRTDAPKSMGFIYICQQGLQAASRPARHFKKRGHAFTRPVAI